MNDAVTAGISVYSSVDREPIHIPGLIQPCRALLAFDGPGTYVRFASRNVGELLGHDWSDALGLSIEDLLGRERGAELRESLADPALDANPTALGMIPRLDGRPYLAIGHAHDGRVILELDGSTPVGLPPFHGLYPEVRTFLRSLGLSRTVDDLARLAAVEVRRITGFDRVLVYRFDRDQHRTVIAEDRDDVLPAYLGHRFPASDIPAQARDLYRLNRLRIIGDVDYEPVPIESVGEARPLDLTFSTLRSVSPIHLEYMRNMGTAASMSISVVVGNRLWGLISCHHRGPRLIPFELRTACEFLGQTLSLQIAAHEHRDESERRIALKSIQTRLLADMAREESSIDGLVKHPEDLLAFARADGAAIVFEDLCSTVGATPAEDDIRRLVAWLAENGRDEVHATDGYPNPRLGPLGPRRRQRDALDLEATQQPCALVPARSRPHDGLEGRPRVAEHPGRHAHVVAAGTGFAS
jgi:two-component system, chemotaxis family, sensor kinase Cph1